MLLFVTLISCTHEEHKIDDTCVMKTNTAYCYVRRNLNDNTDCIYIREFVKDKFTGKVGYVYGIGVSWVFNRPVREPNEFDSGFCSIYKELEN